MSKLLALDQSSRISGWAVFEEKKLIDSGTFTVTDQDIGERLVKIKQKVLDLINHYNIDEVIFEDIQLQNNIMNNVATFKTLAEVIGVLTETFMEINIKFSAVLATTWKSKVGIKGRDRATQKKNAQQYVLNTYNKKVSQDESDAICIGIYKTNLKSDYDWSE